MPKMELLIKKVFSNFNGENNSANHNISDKIGDELDVYAGGLVILAAENKENRRLFHLIIMMTRTHPNASFDLFLFGDDFNGKIVRKIYEVKEETRVSNVDILGSIWGSLVRMIIKMNFID